MAGGGPLDALVLRGGRRRRTETVIGAAVAGALLLACCSSAEPTAVASTTSVDELEAYVEAVFGGLDSTAQSLIQEDLTAVCMNDQGFDYMPTLAGSSLVSFTEMSLAEEAAYRQAEGWGVIAEATGTGVQRPRTTDDHTDEVDPNGEIFDALSESARTAWTTAHRDCFREAVGMASAEGMLADHPDLAALHVTLMELRDDESDPRWQNLNARWAQCMTDRGYPGYTSPSLARAIFTRAHEEAHVVAADEIEDLRALEVATVAADLDCRVEIGDDEADAELREDRASEFLAEHEAEMDEMIVILQEALPRLSDDPATP